jgi:polyisoprenoid-binding protein YceI
LVSIQAGTHELGPENATLQVKTYREGIASKVGHDLVIDVTSWRANVKIGEQSNVQLSADPASLHVREGLRGAKPLTDKDRAEIRKKIEEQVLGREPISFRSTEVDLGDGGSMSVRGELEMAGNTRQLNVELRLATDGSVTASVPLVQSEWGIKPYRGLMGALRVRDSVEIVLDARLPPA